MRRGPMALALLGVAMATPAGAQPGPPASGSSPGRPAASPAEERSGATGPAPGALSHVRDLAACLRLAQRHYPRIAEARARLDQKRAQSDLARRQPFSEWTLTAGAGLAPTVFGSSVYSPNTDVALSSNMGLAWQVGIDGTVPLYTFGKLQSLWQAADAQVQVGEHEVKKEQNQVGLEVRRAFYGVLLARDALALVDEAKARLDKYLGRVAQKVADEEGDDIALLRLQMHRADLDGRGSEARRQERIALAGLRFLTGVTGPFDVPDEPLRRSPHALAPLSTYLSAARLFRPEINMARAGVAARRAQVDLERSRYYPDLGLALSGRWMRAPEVTDQTNPFVRDPANLFSYGFALALRWKLDFLPQAARVAASEAQLEEMRATERYALGGVGFEVEQAFEEARDAAARLSAATRSTGYAKQWMVKVQQGIDVGTFEDEDVADPAKEYATRRFAQMAATYEYNLAIAKLALATGWDIVGDR